MSLLSMFEYKVGAKVRFLGRKAEVVEFDIPEDWKAWAVPVRIVKDEHEHVVIANLSHLSEDY